MLRDCQNKSQLLKGTVQAEHRNTGGGNLNSIQVKTEALRREVAAQGGLTEHEKRLWREPSLHGSSPPPACPECQMPTPVSQPVPRSSQRPGTLWFSLNQTQGLPSRALAPFPNTYLPAMQETWVRTLSGEDPLEKEMAAHSSILAWKIPRMEEPDRLQS